MAGSPVRTRWQAPSCPVTTASPGARELHFFDDGHYIGVLFRMYGVFNVAFGLMAIATTVTAFRRGDGWAWWALLVGNTIALVSAMTYDRTVNAIGPFELSKYLGLAMIYESSRGHSSFPRSGTASSIDGLTRSGRQRRPHALSHCEAPPLMPSRAANLYSVLCA